MEKHTVKMLKFTVVNFFSDQTLSTQNHLTERMFDRYSILAGQFIILPSLGYIWFQKSDAGIISVPEQGLSGYTQYPSKWYLSPGARERFLSRGGPTNRKKFFLPFFKKITL